MSVLISIVIGISVICVARGAFCSSRLHHLWRRYQKQFVFDVAGASPAALISSHVFAVSNIIFNAVIFVSSIYFSVLTLLFILIVGLTWPMFLQSQLRKRKQNLLNRQMDNMLANLANAVSVTGNLFNAMEDVSDGEPEPMQTELKHTIQEIRLGKTEDEALQRFAERSGIPLLITAIGAVIVGKQLGGNLGSILSSTAEGIREIKRLEGVLKVKTAEGRSQAWVMGMIPFFLVGILHLLNPGWLSPLWTTPLGWILAALCVVLEICAVLMIRKILAVTI